MSVNPVPGVEFTNAADTGKLAVPSEASHAPQEGENVHAGDQTPQPKAQTPLSGSVPLQIPEDEVQMQRDNGSGEIIIRYLDGRGNVILQVPSEQVLNLAHAAEQVKNPLTGSHSSKDQSEIDLAGGANHGH